MPARAKKATPPPTPLEKYFEGLADSSRKAMTAAAATCLAILSPKDPDPRNFPWQNLRREHFDKVSAALFQRPGTQRLCAILLRGVLRAAHEMDLVSMEAYQAACPIRVRKNARVQKSSTPAQGARKIHKMNFFCSSEDDFVDGFYGSGWDISLEPENLARNLKYLL